MPRPYSSFPGLFLDTALLIFILSFTGIAMAGERSLVPGGPPVAYRIDEVHLHLTRHPGYAAPPIRQVRLSGTGNATLERGGELVQISCSTRDLVALLNELYKIRFFELPSKYITRYSIIVKDDGTVATSALRMTDAGSTSVCFAVTEYEKCVTYGRDGPRELDSGVLRFVALDA